MFERECLSWIVRGTGGSKNHGTQDSRVVPHRGTNWAALWLTSQIGRDAVLSESYGRGYQPYLYIPQVPILGLKTDIKTGAIA